MPWILIKASDYKEQIYHELMNTPPDFDPRDEERKILGDDPIDDPPEDNEEKDE